MGFKTTRKRLLVLVLAALLGLAGFGFYALCLWPESQISEANAKKIAKGMSLAEVVKILGQPRDYRSVRHTEESQRRCLIYASNEAMKLLWDTNGTSACEFEVVTWACDSHAICVGFADGKVGHVSCNRLKIDWLSTVWHWLRLE